MTLAILIDMNLSRRWVEYLRQAGYSARHWSTVGHSHDEDAIIMVWAASHGHIIFTHDMDFGTSLALSHARMPSVIQIRTRVSLPERVGPLVLTVLRHYVTELTAGALIVIDETKHRVRVLPL